MKKFTTLAACCLFCAQAILAQSEKNYILEINGDTVHISLNEPINVKANGKDLAIKLTKKEFLTFNHQYISFTYPSIYSVTTTKIDPNIEQILLMTAGGNGITIQIYTSVDPSDFLDYMLKEVTSDDIKAGYKQTTVETEKKLKSGLVMKGKIATLTLDDDKEQFAVFGHGKGKKGIIVMEIRNDLVTEDDSNKLFDTFWQSFAVKF